MSGISIITLIIIIDNVLVSLKGFNDQAFFEKYKFNVGRIKHQKEHYRLITSGFLHVDFTHLLFNMLTLYFFAQIVIDFFASPFTIFGDYSMMNMQVGMVLFAVLYLLSIVAGNLLALSVHKNEPYYSAVGASGGVSGILFSVIAIKPTLMLGIFFIIPMPAWIFAVLYLAYSVYGMRKGLGNVGHAAHLGGAILGLAGTIIYFPEIFSINQFYILIMLIPIGVLLVMMLNKKD